jgi:hypothetical protein
MNSVLIFVFIFLVQTVVDTASRASDTRNSTSDLLRGGQTRRVSSNIIRTLEYCLCDNVTCDLRDPLGVKGTDIVARRVQVALILVLPLDDSSDNEQTHDHCTT